MKYYLHENNHFMRFTVGGEQKEVKITASGISINVVQDPIPPDATIQDGTEFEAWMKHMTGRLNDIERTIEMLKTG